MQLIAFAAILTGLTFALNYEAHSRLIKGDDFQPLREGRSASYRLRGQDVEAEVLDDTVLRPSTNDATYNVERTLESGGAVTNTWYQDVRIRTGSSIAEERLRVSSIRDYCKSSDLDGVSDNTECFQNALSDLCSGTAGGGTLLIPAGSVPSINSRIGVKAPCGGIWIVGEGWGDLTQPFNGSQIKVIGSGSAHILHFGGLAERGSRYLAGGGVKNVAFAVTEGATSTIIYFDSCRGCTASGVRTWRAHTSVAVFAGLSNRIADFDFDQVPPDGVAILVEGSDRNCGNGVSNCATRSDLTWVRDGQINAAFSRSDRPQADGIRIKDFAHTTFVVNVTANQVRRGLQLWCPSSKAISSCPAFVSVQSLQAEVNDAGRGGGYGILGTDFRAFICVACQIYGYATVNNVSLSNERFAGASGEVQFIGGTFDTARNACIVSAVKNTFWGSGLTVAGCGTSGERKFGIELRANGSELGEGSQTITGGKFCSNLDGTPTSMTAIFADLAQGFVQVHHNNFSGCRSGVELNPKETKGFSMISDNIGP